MNNIIVIDGQYYRAINADRKTVLKAQHRKLVRGGRYYAARRLLTVLQSGYERARWTDVH